MQETNSVHAQLLTSYKVQDSLQQVNLHIVSQYSMGSGPNWYQIGNKTCYISNVSNFYGEREYLC